MTNRISNDPRQNPLELSLQNWVYTKKPQHARVIIGSNVAHKTHASKIPAGTNKRSKPKLARTPKEAEQGEERHMH